ncbi:MAG: D-alanyl-lipoteichoic acid biosynthesis protein DltB [Peptoniphilaceae bacterium]|uniref:D-alanyl-lipoteichoic acid biosynthesis protein DltB n=1 Tax=Parvimonas sp. TaxID=1944660 RepID=UPI0025E1DF17|nr:D-alanyl-lipoteichoic acid biosynthesis protein DltB [Parvimonas sp.]MCI5997709.1 D-alanyl-lipoteichoic acid biosynthesis protein DltB [Parvimonas sp.]MDD7765563.1 D-alanyl-lipoteichoic acid biosynthesis protein DltB [Peptoniphilaceae bacterium]MDY3051104.1 D-alanyl-lipoteichoic acid biosynthesis protein DltB [Parvimonas sp.]
MSFFSGFSFWIALIVLLIPSIVLGVKEKSQKYYLLFVSLLFVFLIYSKHISSLGALLLFTLYEFSVIGCFVKFRKSENKIISKLSVYVILSLIPLVVNRLIPFVLKDTRWGFLGISYITFKVIQILVEINDNMIEKISFIDYISFMLFFPTISSGPIDRSRRFLKDIYDVKTKNDYLENLGQGFEYILQGVFYKLILSQVIFDKMALVSGRYKPVHLIIYMYLYGFYLFFDFAGYSLMAVGTSKIFGINTPMNFNKPFIAKDMKDFWNRWHISLSHWFRDFVFNRLVFKMFKDKIFKSSLVVAMTAYIVDMVLMGIWHGISLSYLLYGIYHGILLALTEYFQKTKFYKKHKSKKSFKYISIFVTFNLVMFGFFIFSGKFIEVMEIIRRILF